MSNLPATNPSISRSALERVLARAAELQAASGDDSADLSESLTETQLLELGKEVGLSAQHLRQALAEERARVSPLEVEPRGIGGKLFGPAGVAAQRVVPGTPASVLELLDTWMQREEWMVIKRQRPDRIVWEPRRDVFGAVRRMFNVGGRGYALHRTTDVAATAIAVDDQRVLLRLEADLLGHRGRVVGQSAAGGVLGAASTAALVLMGFALPIALAPVVGIAAVSYAAGREVHRHSVTRAQLTLEQLLDRLERGEVRQPSLLNMLQAANVLPRRR
jgi:hypothetical protein